MPNHRINAQTHWFVFGQSEGWQWVLSDATLCLPVRAEGGDVIIFFYADWDHFSFLYNLFWCESSIQTLARWVQLALTSIPPYSVGKIFALAHTLDDGVELS